MPDVSIPESAARRVFLDTGVIVDYQRGAAEWLFGAAALSRFHYVISDVVTQELVLAGEYKLRPERFEFVWAHVEVLPVSLERAEALLPAFRTLWSIHVNDFLNYGTAWDCDLFATDDAALLPMSGHGPAMISSMELRRLAEAATVV